MALTAPSGLISSFWRRWLISWKKQRDACVDATDEAGAIELSSRWLNPGDAVSDAAFRYISRVLERKWALESPLFLLSGTGQNSICEALWAENEKDEGAMSEARRLRNR